MQLCRNAVLLTGCLSGVMLFAQNPNRVASTPVSNLINSELPSWLSFSGEDRARMENLSGVGFKSVGDLYLLNRLRLNMEVRPLRWLKFDFDAQDSRVFGQNTLPAPASQKDVIDLRLGYVEVGSEEGPVLLRAGRQTLNFGEGRLVSDGAWGNVGRSFDAARVTLRHGASKVDLFTGTTVKTDCLNFNMDTPGQHFHGAYGSLGKLIPKATVEPYAFWRLEHGYKSETGTIGNLDEKTIGLRLVGTLPFRFDYGAELADQVGSSAGDRVSAWAAHWIVGYTLQDTPHKPRVFSELNRASGDGGMRDGVHGQFDPLFASTHDKIGLTDLFSWTNIVHSRTGFEFIVRPGVKVAAAYDSAWLANATDGLYVGGKLFARSSDGSAGTHIAQEADMQAAWTISRSTQINVGYGRIFPGEFLHHITAGVPYNLVFFSVTQRF